MITRGEKKLTFPRLASFIAIVVFVLAACAQPTPAPVTTTEEAAPAATEAAGPDPMQAATYEEWVAAKGVSDESFELHVISPYDPSGAQGGYKQYVEFIIEEFNKLYPNVTVNYEVVGWGEIDAKTTEYALAGTPLDVALNWDGATAAIVQQDLAEPLDGKLPKWAVENIIPALITPPFNSTFDGQLYMWPEHMNAIYVVARRDLLVQAGVNPDEVKSYDDFLAALDAVSTQTDMTDPLGFMLGGSYAAMDQSIWFFNGNGLESMADFSNQEAWIETARFIDRLLDYTPEAALNWVYPETERAYATGVIGVYPHGNWLITARAYDQEGIFTPEKTVAIPLPYGSHAEEGTPFYVPSANGYYLMKRSEHKEAALDFMLIASLPQGTLHQEVYTIPSIQDWTQEEKLAIWPEAEDMQWWFDEWDKINTERAMLAPGLVARGEFEQRWYEILIDLYNDKTTPEQMFDDFKAFAEPILEELGR